ncbi:MAG: WD40 repeat domain-containing protein [bacterium]
MMLRLLLAIVLLVGLGSDAGSALAAQTRIQPPRFLRVIGRPGWTLRALAISPDVGVVALGEYTPDRSPPIIRVSVWSVTTGQLLRSIPVPEVPVSLGFSPDGRRLVVATFGDTVVMVDPSSGRIESSFRSGIARHDRVMVMPDGQSVLLSGSGQREQSVALWDLASAARRWSVELQTSPCGPLVFPDGNRIITGPDASTWSGTLSLRDTRTGRVIRDLRLHSEPEKTFCALSPDGRLLAAYGTSGKVNPWGGTILNTTTWRQIVEFPRGADRWPEHVLLQELAFSPDGRFLAVAGDMPGGAAVEIRLARSFAPVARISAGGAGAVQFSTDGSLLAFLQSFPRTAPAVELWDVRPMRGRR